jgi:hypothetical protein
MRDILRLALSALIGSLVLGCLIPVPVGHDRHRGDPSDRGRNYDRSWDHGDRDWHRDRDGWGRDDDSDRRHRWD